VTLTAAARYGRDAAVAHKLRVDASTVQNSDVGQRHANDFDRIANVTSACAGASRMGIMRDWGSS
jgi:hypothetical protein